MAIVYKLKSAQGNNIEIKGPNHASAIQATAVPNTRCPHCMHMGAFTPVLPQDFQIAHRVLRGGAPFNLGPSTVGIRACPNADCRGLALVVIDGLGKTIVLPSEVLDFDSTDIPPTIAASLEEAIKCHSAQCYKAAALMVRRVLEELCEERGAKGGNLKERIVSLSALVVIPHDLYAYDDHRLIDACARARRGL